VRGWVIRRCGVLAKLRGSLGHAGQLPGNVVVGHNNSGRPVVFVRGNDNALWHN